MRQRRHLLALVVSLACVGAWGISRVGLARVDDGPGGKEKAAGARAGSPADRGATTWTTAVEPRPLGANAKKGLDWLVEHQLPGGGWGEGEESAQMRGGGERASFRDTPNVADTCIALLALIRSGSTPREGPYRGAIDKGVRYVRSQVEQSDAESLAVSGVRGTRVQMKLGPNIDTFLASMLLAEVKGRMPDGASEKAVDLALHKVIGKIERHQKHDGAFEGNGWAPVLAQAMSGKGINRAKQAGARVSDVTLARAEDGARRAFEASRPPLSAALHETGGPILAAAASPAPRGGMAGGMGGMGSMRGMGAMMAGSAGVELYGRAANLGVLQDSVNTSKAEVAQLRERVANARDRQERTAAEKKLVRIAEVEKVQKEAQAAVVERLDDPQFIAGFGSNGGEEFLSYMNLAESLVVKGGDEWKRWDAKMTANLNRVQNQDGSWSGSHCITGRTFCTSTALLVLMADRTPVPVQAGAKTVESRK